MMAWMWARTGHIKIAEYVVRDDLLIKYIYWSEHNGVYDWKIIELYMKTQSVPRNKYTPSWL